MSEITIVRYLDEAVDRLVGMVVEVNRALQPDDPILRVIKHVDTELLIPFVWIYPGAFTAETVDSETEKELYSVNIRYVLGHVTEGFDGALADRLWLWLPTLRKYFRERKGLIYRDDQKKPPFLDTTATRIPQASGYGQFSGSPHIGLEFRMTLGFTVTHQTVLGNH